jgi:hypothetical protein
MCQNILPQGEIMHTWPDLSKSPGIGRLVSTVLISTSNIGGLSESLFLCLYLRYTTNRNRFREALQEVAPFAIKFIFGAMLTIFIITTLTPVFESKSHRSNESDSVANDDYEKGYQYYGFDIRHNIGQFIPNWVAHPVESFTPDVISDIQHKIRDLDYKYSSLKRKTDLDGQTISKIEKSLPNFLVVKKNKNGKTEIPYEFWAALRDLIQSDDDLLQNPTSSAQESSGQGLLAKEIEKKAGRMWDKYIKENQAKLSFEEKFPHLFKKNIRDTKPYIFYMILLYC